MKKIFIVFSLLFFVMFFACQKKENPIQPSEPTKTFTPTSTFTITPIPNSTVVYDFEDGTIMGWTVFQGGTTRTANVASTYFYNTHSLRIDGVFTSSASSGAGVAPAITNITNTVLRAQIFIPADFPGGGGSIFIQSGSDWCWQNGEWSNFQKGKWNEVIFDTLNPGYTASGCTPDLTDVKRIGVFFLPSSNYSGSVYVDYFTITPYTYTLIKANDPNIKYYGRWDLTDPTVAKNGWGTTYLVTGFYGTSLTLRLSAWDVWFGYAIDGDIEDHTKFTKFEVKNQKDQYNATPTQTPYTITGLSDGPHTIMIVRRTEAMSGVINFTGFGLDIGKTLFTPSYNPTRKMEFIGDSITCGSYDEWQGSNPCPEQWGGCIQNGDMSFGPQLARMYGAEWRTTSRGGIGIYRNCNGCDPPATMPTVYPMTVFQMTPTPAPTYDFSSWQPDVVVIALGTNDFSSGTPDKTSFQTTYSDFLTSLRTYYPNAFILCTEPIPSWMGATAGQYIQEVVNNKSDSRIFYIAINNPPITSDFPLPTTDYSGDNTHPIVSAHTKVANALKQWIDDNIKDDLGW